VSSKTINVVWDQALRDTHNYRMTFWKDWMVQWGNSTLLPLWT